jgi:DNA mismatch endonuclease, patch repair protein
MGDARPMAGWTSTQAGRHLSGRSSRNTAPELALRRALHGKGLRFRLHRTLERGCTPDILLPRHRIAVFVDGCWWHQCPEHGRKTPFSGPNADLWQEKFRRNQERDKRSTSLAQEHGFKVIRLWECEVMADAHAAACRVSALVANGGATSSGSQP